MFWELFLTVGSPTNKVSISFRITQNIFNKSRSDGQKTKLCNSAKNILFASCPGAQSLTQSMHNTHFLKLAILHACLKHNLLTNVFCHLCFFNAYLIFLYYIFHFIFILKISTDKFWLAKRSFAKNCGNYLSSKNNSNINDSFVNFRLFGTTFRVMPH